MTYLSGPAEWLYKYRAAMLAGVFGALVILNILLSVNQTRHETGRAEFELKSQGIVIALASEFASIAGSLHSLKAIIEAFELIPDQKALSAMSAAIIADNNAIQAIKWIPQNNAALHKSVNLIPIQQGLTALSITPQTDQAKLDLSAFERACRSAQQTATAPVFLLRGEAKELGIILIEAVFHAPPKITDSCHDRLKGFVIVVIKAEGLINQVTHNLRGIIDSHIYDVSNTQDPPRLLYQGAEHDTHPVAGYSYSRNIDSSGRTFLLLFKSMPGYFSNAISGKDWILLGGLLLLTVILMSYMIRNKSRQSMLSAKVDTYEADKTNNAALVAAILDNSPAGIITIGLDACIETYNAACTTIFGYSANEVIGKNISMLMPPVQRSKHDSHVQNFKPNDRPTLLGGDRGVLMGLSKSGQEIPLEITIAKFQTGERTHLVGAIHNLTRQKKFERQLSEQSVRAEEIKVEDANFVHNLCHHLASHSEDLLTTIQLLQEGTDTSTDQNKALSLASSQASLVAMIARNTLEVAVAYRKGPGATPAIAINVYQLFDECVALMSPVSAQQGVDIKCSVAAALRINVLTDAARLHLLITNILAIVIDLTGRGFAHLEAQLIMQDSESITFRASVTTGEDIDAALLSQLRDAISGTLPRGDLSHASVALAVCKNMVEGLHGNIGLNRTPGRDIGIWFTATAQLADQ